MVGRCMYDGWRTCITAARVAQGHSSWGQGSRHSAYYSGAGSIRLAFRLKKVSIIYYRSFTSFLFKFSAESLFSHLKVLR